MPDSETDFCRRPSGIKLQTS